MYVRIYIYRIYMYVRIYIYIAYICTFMTHVLHTYAIEKKSNFSD